MPKKVEKEPLLFVDTGYLGCFVSEQSYFKTPTEKPNNVSNPDYVHNYASADFFDFDQFKVSHPDSGKKVEKLQVSDALEEEEYEHVDILVDEEEDSLLDQEEPFDLMNNIKVEETEFFDDQNNITIEEVEIEAPVTERLNEEELELDGFEVIEKIEVEDDFIEDDSEEIENPMDEKQRELLLFIQDLTNRPSTMKAPIVQIVKKDGTLKSGILNLANETTVSIDNLMNEVEEISISSIEGIRILHM